MKSEARRRKGKIVNVLGHEVSERDLKTALRDVVKMRGLKGDLILDKKMTRKEQLQLLKEGEGSMYANVYKYAFF